jgi:hypothetical protein
MANAVWRKWSTVKVETHLRLRGTHSLRLRGRGYGKHATSNKQVASRVIKDPRYAGTYRTNRMRVRMFPVGAPSSFLATQHLAFLLRVHTLTKAGNSITSICVVGSALNRRNDMTWVVRRQEQGCTVWFWHCIHGPD